MESGIDVVEMQKDLCNKRIGSSARNESSLRQTHVRWKGHKKTREAFLWSMKNPSPYKSYDRQKR